MLIRKKLIKIFNFFFQEKLNTLYSTNKESKNYECDKKFEKQLQKTTNAFEKTLNNNVIGKNSREKYRKMKFKNRTAFD